MPRSKQQNQKLKDERREQLMSEALRIFAARGFAATKAADIAAASGISQGLMYHYFQSKEDIFVQLVRRAFDRLNEACLTLERMAIPPRDKIALALDGLLQNLAQDGDAARYHMLVAHATISDAVPKEAKAIVKKHNRLPYEVIARIMAAGQQDGSIWQHDPQELALVFWTTIKGLAMHKAIHGKRFKPPDPRILHGLFF